MKTDNLSESFWRRIKFILLFTLAIVILYIIQTKYIVKIPVVDNGELLEAINNYETIIKKQNEYKINNQSVPKIVPSIRI